MSRLLIFTFGLFLVGWFPALPERGFGSSLPVISGVLLAVTGLLVPQQFLKRLCSLCALLCFGISYGIFSGYLMLDSQLPEPYVGQSVKVTGYIEGLPAVSVQSVRFEFRVTEVDDVRYAWLQKRKVRLSWYQRGEVEHAVPESSQRWQLELKLRRPRGFVNPYGFDYQRWLLSQHIVATGYVRESSWNRFVEVDGLSLDRLRWVLREAISQLRLTEETQALLTALTVGDKSLVSEHLWRQLSRAGVVHLLVVSGLHIGMVALMGYWLGCGAGRLAGLFWKPNVAHYWGGFCSVLMAASYALLSGFGLPAQRALMMVVTANLMLALSRYISRGMGFSIALAAVAIADPLATHSSGFWLSFTAVAILLWLLPERSGKPQPALARVWLFARAQWLIFIGLFAVLMFWQLPQSPASPLVNFVAVPWLSFLVVPFCLLAVVVYPLSAAGAELLWSIAGWQLDLFASLLEYIPDAVVPAPAQTLPVMAALLIIAVLLIMPRGLPGKPLALLLIAALLFTGHERRPPLTVAILDVGQGLAVAVNTAKHSLIYDAGPLYSDRFGAGEGIVVPYIRGLGVRKLNTLIISHGDLDHAGGAPGLQRHFQPDLVVRGEISRNDTVSRTCQRGDEWQWDEVKFRVLYPDSTNHPSSSNNKSCVLLISYRDIHILLPGDIEQLAESDVWRAFKEAGGGLPLALLAAPHHGSATSSSEQFVRATKPQNVVYSAGFKHHFGHPHPKVVERYRSIGARQWNTATSGAVIFSWDQRGELQVGEQRRKARRYWYQ